MRVNANVANLPRKEVSEFLVGTVLVKGVAVLSSIMFFNFEVASCWIENIDSNLCDNTATAANYLGLYAIMAQSILIVRQTVPKDVRKMVSVTKEEVATMNLNIKEQIQVSLVVISLVCTLALLSSLGVSSMPSRLNGNIGQVGLATSGMILLVEILTLNNAEMRQDKAKSEATSYQLKRWGQKPRVLLLFYKKRLIDNNGNHSRPS